MLYLAYGSNLHPLRLGERAPSARLERTVALDGRRLVLHKRGRDGSAKCDLLHTGDSRDRAFGAVYRIDSADRASLDRCEGLGKGYEESTLVLAVEGERLDCFTYLAQAGHIDAGLRPYDWYRTLVLLGALRLGLPADYIERLRRVPCIEDPDRQRRGVQEQLIERLRAADGAPE